ncbi:MAG: DUF4368 domain-containing protein [Defluviitaleaceae bacterium]|nr:DUF4368 domain-containing protein [Defluviitaleaceae bacterium]MCL2263400.1 DUF4368 domain-containing protein [Defluviitaleaceae bacterium]
MSEKYEQEQQDLKLLVENLQMQIASHEEERQNVNRFISLARKCTNVTELTAELLHELVAMVLVHAPDKSTGKRTQKIEVCFQYIGSIDELIFMSGPPPEEIQAISAKNR